MTRILLLITGLLITFLAESQELVQSRTTSPYTYICRVTERQALDLVMNRKGLNAGLLFREVADSFPTGTRYEGRLKPGNYVMVHTDRDRVKLELSSLPNVHLSVIDNKTDLLIQVRDTTGMIVDDAEVKSGGRVIPWDKATMAYRLARTNRKGIFTVAHDGTVSLFRLERTLNNSALRRSARKVAYTPPGSYIWVPVKTVILLPYDAVRSAIRGYGFGVARGLWWQLRRSFGPRPSDGFMLFSKPLYSPGDTLMMKAFVVRGKGKKPFTGEAALTLTLYNPYRQVRLGELKPYAPGGFTFTLPLSDTLGLRLDNNYRLALTTVNGRHDLISGSFRYEYYDLKSMRLVMRVPDSVLYRGREMAVGLKALNENDMILPDARVTLHILTGTIEEILGPQLTVSDTIGVINERLSPSGETMVMIPDSIFPDASLRCTIVAVANSADNESVTETRDITFFHRKEEIGYSASHDSLRFFLTINGTGKEREALLVTTDAFGNSEPPQLITLPWSVKSDPFTASYQVTSGDALLDLAAHALPHGITPQTYRTADSLFITAFSNTGLAFNYFIYDLNREVSRGTTDTLHFSSRVTSDRRWYLSLSYLWGGVMNNSIYEISRDAGRLNITATQPEKIIPGRETTITLTVTDLNGAPVPDADITAFSLTRKFAYELPSLPHLARAQRGKEHINSFRTTAPLTPIRSLPLSWEWWSARGGLDTVPYYRFRYHPEETALFISEMGDSITQFAPFIFREGMPVRINQIYIDHRPVYIDFASVNQPYSFRVDSGFHFVRIRTHDAIYEADSIRFIHGKKVILSIRDSDKPVSYLKRKAPTRLTAQEQQKLARYIMPYRSGFDNSVAWLRQGDNLLLLSDVERQLRNPDWLTPASGRRIAGPVMPATAQFVLPGEYTTEFTFEPLYEYEFGKSLLKMRSFRAEERVPSRYPAWGAATDFRSSVLTTRSLEQTRLEILEKRSAPRYRHSRNEPPLPGNGTLSLLNSSGDERGTPLLIALVSHSGDMVYDRQGRERSITNITPGTYRFMALHTSGLHEVIDTVVVRANSTTVVDMAWAEERDDPEMSNRVIEIINAWRGVSGASVAPGRVLMQELTRRVVGSYEGPGFTVSGRVTALSDNEPIPGVTVYSPENGYGTVTDYDGHYSLTLPYGDHRLMYSFIGMKPYETTLSFDQSLDVVLEEDMLALDEVVVTAYGLSQKRVSTASVVTALQGRASGIEVADAAPLHIRGLSSEKGSTPLIVVDGVPWSGDMSLIDPALINSVTVIREPSLMALYGSRAAGGVIMLTMRPGGILAAATGSDLPADSQFMEEAMAAGSLRTNFRDYGYWRPGLRTDRQGRVSFTVTFPDDITSWETFAVAINGRRQAGSAKGAIRAYMPVTAQLPVPHYLVDGDSLNLIGRIMNHTGVPLSLTSRFISNGDTLMTRRHKLAEAIIDTLPVSAAGTVTVTTTATATTTTTASDAVPADIHADAPADVSAVAPDSLRLEYSFTTDEGLFDGEYRPLPVKRAGVEIDSGSVAMIGKGSSVTLDLAEWPGEVSLRAVAAGTDIMRTASLRLINYLYGCNEQVASRLAGYLTAAAIDRQQGRVSHRDEREIKSLIRKLLENRNREGLWGWWGRADTEEWISNHIIKVLLRASRQGYSVNLGIPAITEYAVWSLEKEPPTDTGLILLEILSGIEAKADYNRYLTLLSERENLTLTDSIRIASLRLRYGVPADISFLTKARRGTLLGGVWFTAGTKGGDASRTDLQTTLLAYELLCRDTLQTIARPEELHNYFYEYLSLSGPLNTYQTASVLNALSVKHETELKGKPEFHPVLNLMNEPDNFHQRDSKDSGRARMRIVGEREMVVDSFPYSTILPPDKRQLTISNEGPTPLFISLGSKLFVNSLREDSASFRITTRWSSQGSGERTAGEKPEGAKPDSQGPEGASVREGGSAPESESMPVSRVRSGVPVTLTAEVEFFRSADYVVIEIPVPSGFSYSEKKGYLPGEVHREFYRDHVAIFLRHTIPGRRSFVITLMPRFTGSYIMNPARVYPMYFPVISSNNEVKRVTVY